MKIAIDIGHNTRYDGGATGIMNENVCAKEVGTLLIQKLVKAGHEVINCLPKDTDAIKSTTDSLRMRCETANGSGAEIYVSIHFNSGGGTGTEVLYISDKGKALGEPILNSVVKILGSTKRGLVLRPNLYVLKNTNMPAVIVECLFVDSSTDSKLYNADKIAEGILVGITGKGSGQTQQAPQQTPQQPSQEVKNLQISLNLMGFKDIDMNKLAEDGYIGEKTKSAAKNLYYYLTDTILK